MPVGCYKHKRLIECGMYECFAHGECNMELIVMLVLLISRVNHLTLG